MRFEELELKKGLQAGVDAMGFSHPTPIQADAFKVVRSGRDVIGIAQTGTGKTLAYLLPLIQDLPFSKEGLPRVLVVVPTRELVVQVVEEARRLTEFLSVRVVGAYGGVNIKTQKAEIQEGVDILVGTPGRLMDLGFSGVPKLKSVKKLVIDEVDEMLALGFRTQIKNLLDLLPQKRQNLLFSASMTDEVEELIETFFNPPVKIEETVTGTPVEKIDQRAYTVPNFNTKVNLLVELLRTDETMQKVLVFAGTKRFADLLGERLEAALDAPVGVIHSNKSQNYRLRQVEQFDDGTLRVLIASDIIARGLDFADITHVVNFHVPDIPINYMHRVGRTGRADKQGVALLFEGENEGDYRTAIETLMGTNIREYPVPEGVVFVDELIPEEEVQEVGGDVNYLPGSKRRSPGGGGAFHEKKLKNTKVNRAKDKRRARMLEKKKAKRKKK